MPQRYNKKRKSKSSAAPKHITRDKRRGKSAAPEPLDPEYCHSSESEPEDYGDLHGQDKWEIDGVVDSHCGENDRMSYKIRWDKEDWQRADGTSEEWIPEPVDNRSIHANLVKKYGAREFSKLEPLEARPLDMSFEGGRFYSHMNFLAPGCSKNLWNQTGYQGVFAVGDAPVSRFYMTDPDFIPGDHEDDSDSDSNAGRQATRRARNTAPKRERNTSVSLGGTPPGSQQVALTALQELEVKWNQAASAAGAGPITLTNNIDSSIPPLRKFFEYSEMELHWSLELKKEGYPLSAESFIKCDCYECDRPYRCGCQKPIVDSSQPQAFHEFAYDKRGRFNLNFEGISVECNAKCRCPATCQNRVVQHPRTVHIEIVKFEIGGWGVRARQDIVAGQVLGSFTGEIITKEASLRIPDHIAAEGMATGRSTRIRDRNKFLFDLDSQNSKYTLDSWGVGNWARFINHKCEPNLQVFSVCYDTLPETGLERIALAALRDIPAGEELGIDYQPYTRAGEGYKLINKMYKVRIHSDHVGFSELSPLRDPVNAVHRLRAELGHNNDCYDVFLTVILLLTMDAHSSNHVPPPLYSEDPQSNQSGVDLTPLGDQPLILITPSEGKATFQSGFLGAEGDVSSLEGEVHIKSASMEKWQSVTITYRSEEHVGINKVELGFSKHVLYSQQQAQSSSTSPDTGTLPGVLPFSIPLTPDTPQCLHTSTSAISHTLTVTMDSSTLPPTSKLIEVHTRRYTTITSPYLPVAPRRISLDAPTPTTVEIPRTIFRSGEPIPIYWDIPPPDSAVVQRGVRLRNLRAELVRLIRVDTGDEDDDAESLVSEDETGWAPAEPDMNLFNSPPPTAGFEKGSSMQADQQSASGSLPSGGPIHPTILTRSGAPARFHPTRHVQVRLVLHGLSHDPDADIQRQENTHEICASISQTTLMHDVSFHVILRASFLIDGQERTIKARIPVTIIPRVIPQVEVPGEIEEAYMKKHDRPPARTVRAADADHGEGPSNGPPPAFEEGPIIGNELAAPPPFVDAPYTAPPMDPSGSQPPAFQESESRANEYSAQDGRLPTFFESESAAVAASSSSTSRVRPPAPSGTFGEWTQTSPSSGMELRFPGEGSAYGFAPHDQFDGLTLGLSHNEQGLPNDPGLSHSHSRAVLSPDILADINSDPPPPLTPVGDDPVSNLAMRLQLLAAAASSETNEAAPPPPPALDDPADPPPSINDHFRHSSGHTSGGAGTLTEAPQPVHADGALPPYLNPGVAAPSAAGPPAYTDVPPREGH